MRLDVEKVIIIDWHFFRKMHLGALDVEKVMALLSIGRNFFGIYLERCSLSLQQLIRGYM